MVWQDATMLSNCQKCRHEVNNVVIYLALHLLLALRFLLLHASHVFRSLVAAAGSSRPLILRIVSALKHVVDMTARQRCFRTWQHLSVVAV
jgi:hypothetical protein